MEETIVPTEETPTFIGSIVQAVENVFTPADEAPEVVEAPTVVADVETPDEVSVVGMTPPVVEVIDKGDGATQTIYH